ncbi:hypothetical protein JXB22_01160 [candidate division WOR-3 bacterium]|nr:hypothetical protein [candidate division WOR-3 bacterium]
MKIITEPIPKDTVLKEHNSFFHTMIKAVVDIEKRIVALDAELHADLEAFLLQQDSKQEDLWGINLYLEKTKADWIEYTAMVNIRPSMNSRDMEIQDEGIRKKICDIIYTLIV